MTKKPILAVKNLSARLKTGRELLHDLNFTLTPGETTVLIGPNGAGKSTVAGALMGDPRFVTSGKVKFQNQNLLTLAPDKRAKLGLFTSFQTPVEIPGISTTEMLRAALREKTNAYVSLDDLRAKITTAAKTLNTDVWFSERELGVGFSGGEKKRAEILQMLVSEPKLAILDEIDSGLDLDATKTISEALRDYQAQTGCTYLIITHNMHILDVLSPSRAILMHSGHIATVGGKPLLDAIKQRGFKPVLADLAKKEAT